MSSQEINNSETKLKHKVCKTTMLNKSFQILSGLVEKKLGLF